MLGGDERRNKHYEQTFCNDYKFDDDDPAEQKDEQLVELKQETAQEQWELGESLIHSQ